MRAVIIDTQFSILQLRSVKIILDPPSLQAAIDICTCIFYGPMAMLISVYAKVISIWSTIWLFVYAKVLDSNHTDYQMDRSSHHPLGTVESNMLQGSFAPHSFAPRRATQKLRTWKILPFFSIKFHHFVERPNKKKLPKSKIHRWTTSWVWPGQQACWVSAPCTRAGAGRSFFNVFLGGQHETADAVAVLVYCVNIQRRYGKPVVLHIQEYPFLDTSDCITFDPFA